MKRFAVVLAVLLAGGSAWADSYQKYFPLKKGNTWTFDHESGTMSDYTTVTSSFGSVHHVTGIPGAQSGLWLAWSGNTLYAWRKSTQSWEALFNFGVAAGTTYAVTLDYPFWTNAQVTLKVKGFDSYNPVLDRTFKNAFHFVVAGEQEGQPKEFVFAPNVGPIFHSFWLNQTYDRYFLRSAVLGGKKYGLVTQQTLESGSLTQYPVQGKNKVYLINSKSAWQWFYAKHNPGVAAPKADFSKQTVVVVLAGQRPTGGYGVALTRVTWNYPSSSATVHVVETLPFESVTQGITSPFTIALLDEKVYSASVDWKTKKISLPGPNE